MGGNVYSEFLPLDEFNYFYSGKNDLGIDCQKNINTKKNKPKKDIINESNKFVGNPLIIGDIEGYEIIDFKLGFDLNYINLALKYDYDFICWKKCDSFENVDNYYKRS